MTAYKAASIKPDNLSFIPRTYMSKERTDHMHAVKLYNTNLKNPGAIVHVLIPALREQGQADL